MVQSNVLANRHVSREFGWAMRANEHSIHHMTFHVIFEHFAAMMAFRAEWTLVKTVILCGIRFYFEIGLICMWLLFQFLIGCTCQKVRSDMHVQRRRSLDMFETNVALASYGFPLTATDFSMFLQK